MKHAEHVQGFSLDEELKSVAQDYETQAPQEVLKYALDRFSPRIILGCSFGAEDVVVVDMIHRIKPDTPLFYLDTDFLFPETYALRDRLVDHYGLSASQVLHVTSLLTPVQQTSHYGEALWERDPDRCCAIRKVEPLTRILKGYSAWITGIRRDQTPQRANAGLIEWDNKFGLVKVNPLARWSVADVWAYIHVHEVPYNSLHDQHYPSLGCIQCTAPVNPGDDPRSGRWSAKVKTECGLHQ